MKNFEISKELGDKVLAYLGSRPAAEVFELIIGMTSLKEIVEEGGAEIEEAIEEAAGNK